MRMRWWGGRPAGWRPVIGGLLAAVVTVVAAGCGGTSSSTSATSKSASAGTGSQAAASSGGSKTPFTVGVFSGPYLVWAGIALHMFNNLPVKFVTISSGPAELPLLETGQMAGIDELGAPPLAIAYARNVGLKIVWIDGREQDYFVGNANLKSPSALRGKTFGEPIGSIAQFLLDQYLTQHGVNPSATHVVNIPPPAMPAALKSGEINGALIWPPASIKMAQQGGTVLYHTTDTDFIGLSSQFIAAHPSEAQTLVCDWGAIHRAFFADPARVYAAIAKATGETVASVEQLLPKSAVAPVNQVSPQWMGTPKSPSTIAPFLVSAGQWLLGQKSIPKAPSLSWVQSAFDTSYAQAVAGGSCPK